MKIVKTKRDHGDSGAAAGVTVPGRPAPALSGRGRTFVSDVTFWGKTGGRCVVKWDAFRVSYALAGGKELIRGSSLPLQKGGRLQSGGFRSGLSNTFGHLVMLTRCSSCEKKEGRFPLPVKDCTSGCGEPAVVASLSDEASCRLSWKVCDILPMTEESRM